MSIWYEKLDNYCLEHGISIREASNQLGISHNTVGKWRHRNPSPDHIERVRRFLEKSTATTEAITEVGLFRQDKSPLMLEKKEESVMADSLEKSEELLSESEIKDLLVQHEIIRDPVHGDIWITALERAVIDSPAFQRLHNLAQLGPMQLVYPGATHNRFLHSIGTLFCAEELVRVVNRNHKVYSQPFLLPVDGYPHLIIRLCALLHDLAHMPYGHTLEDEGNLLSDEWNDEKRVQLWLEDESERSVSSAIRKYLSEKGIAAEKINTVINDVRKYLIGINNSMDYEYPYIFDIISNTLCADLLDYVERDMYFCGLRERSGDRVVKYLAVMRLISEKDPKKGENKKYEFHMSTVQGEGKGRLVLLAYRFEREHGPGDRTRPVRKQEILSEAIDLLRRRFALAEKVYFHRTKIAASAMLISAVGSHNNPIESLYSLGDAQFLAELKRDNSEENERCRYLVSAYEDRRLYKPVFRIDFIQKEEKQLPHKLWNEIYPKYRIAVNRKKIEEEIEYLADLPHGSISVYCPDQKMNLKEFELLVHNQPEDKVKMLKNTLDGNREQEMKTINDRFAQLWKLQVFVDPAVMDASQLSNPAVQDLATLCESLIDFPNSILELQRKGKQVEFQMADRVIKEWEEENKGKLVPHRKYEELVNTRPRGSVQEKLESYRSTLNTLMETGNI